ncbi:MAG: putative toxin-antitoxin system toxin component, PIN family [Burkholderiales bacterium]|nr:putative toxin-antitoxin system toxin component, PIN family [Burkholderiales bacterium]
MRVVLDTNVLLSGIAYPASVPGQVVAAWRSGACELVLSEAILQELERNLPRMKRLGWDAGKARHYVSLLRFACTLVDIDAVPANVPRDRSDDPILATLIASGADCLVTGDADLLELAAQHPILTPAEFWARHG